MATNVNDPYELIGEWTFNDTISVPSSMDYAIDGSYYGYSPNATYTVSRLYTNNRGALCLANISIYTSNGWHSLAPHVLNITGGEALTDETFATWLKANAVKTPVEPPTDAVTIEYNGSVIASLKAGQSATLPCKDLPMLDDVVVSVPDGMSVVEEWDGSIEVV